MKKKPVLLSVMIILTCCLTVHSGEAIGVNIDKDLKAIWGHMINRLASRDIEGALSYFTYSSRWRYKEEFTSSEDKLREMSSKMGKIEPVYIKDDEAKYRIRIGNAGDEYTHYIWFRKDISGTWKIDKF